jgi:hypothetical protein
MSIRAPYRGVPEVVLDNTVKNATRAKLEDEGLSMAGARGGIPFPIPKNGNEVMFNYLAATRACRPSCRSIPPTTSTAPASSC